jgi:hypothetical protein
MNINRLHSSCFITHFHITPSLNNPALLDTVQSLVWKKRWKVPKIQTEVTNYATEIIQFSYIPSLDTRTKDSWYN